MKSIKARLSKFNTVDEYIAGWGAYYYGAGILIPTRKIQDIGTEVALLIEIATGEQVLRGEGVVEEVRSRPDGSPIGLVVRFTRLDARSKALVQRILAEKREQREEAEAAHQPAAPAAPALAPASAADLGALADAVDETFDKIFASGAFGAVTSSKETPASQPAVPAAAADAPVAEAPAEDVFAAEPPVAVPAIAELSPTPAAPVPAVADLPAGGDDELEPVGDAAPGKATKAVTQALAALGLEAPIDIDDTPSGSLPAITEPAVSGAFLRLDSLGSGAASKTAEDPDAIDIAIEESIRSAREGEAAIDMLLLDAPAPDTMSAAIVPVAKKGLLARFFGWLAGLFGGGK